MQGSSKWRPGPREPPFFSRPSLNTTARSYSVTTCSQQMMISIDIVLYDLEAEEHGEGEGDDDDHPGDGLQHHAHQPQPGVAGVAWRSYWSFTDVTKTILTRQYWHWDFALGSLYHGLSFQKKIFREVDAFSENVSENVNVKIHKGLINHIYLLCPTQCSPSGRLSRSSWWWPRCPVWGSWWGSWWGQRRTHGQIWSWSATIPTYLCTCTWSLILPKTLCYFDLWHIIISIKYCIHFVALWK